MKTPKLPSPTAQALYRSATAAQMAQLPVATLRVWERRYQVASPQLSPSGQRLYSSADVERLALIKRLNEQGHAIGQLAGLDMPELQRIAATQSGIGHGLDLLPECQVPEHTATWRVVVIGADFAHRLQHPNLLRQLHRPIEVLGVFDEPAQAVKKLGKQAPDAVLLRAPSLHAEWLPELLAAAPAWSRVAKVLLYGFAADALCQSLASSGVALHREPISDASLGRWLSSLSASNAAFANAQRRQPKPRLWNDQQLAQFATQTSSVACECPRHIAELLQQLAQFETYSSECSSRNPADAALHAYLNQVAAASRTQFESALQRVALHEGLVLA